MIYIMTHKKFNDPKMDGYVPLQVGAEGKTFLGYLRDNVGNNISLKNPNYCELTGMYWVWKNCEDEYKGLVHYRRYFGKNFFSSNARYIYSYDTLIEFTKKVDIVLPYIECFKQSAKDEILIRCCTDNIFNKLENIVKRMYPSYGKSFDIFFSQNKSTLFNMLFCKSNIYDSYCEWLFSILFELEKQVDMSVLDDYQKRLYGFLSERLLNIWVLNNHLKVKNLSVINTELGMKEKITLVRRRITNDICFTLKRL